MQQRHHLLRFGEWGGGGGGGGGGRGVVQAEFTSYFGVWWALLEYSSFKHFSETMLFFNQRIRQGPMTTTVANKNGPLSGTKTNFNSKTFSVQMNIF